MEPPSPILEQNFAADQNSDDPLSHNIYMIMGDVSGDDRSGLYVCAWSARTGMSYIGKPAEHES